MSRRKKVQVTRMSSRALRSHEPGLDELMGVPLRQRTLSETFVAATAPTVYAPPTLLTGRAVAHEYADAKLKVYLLDLTEEQQEAIASTDYERPALPSQLACAAHSLWSAGLRLQEVSVALDLGLRTSAMHRIVKAHRSLTPYGKRMLDEGHITWAHTRVLSDIGAGEQDVWTGRVVAQRMSLANLERMHKGQSEANQASPDQDRYRQSLCQALGADDVQLTQANNQLNLHIGWSSVEVLQGVCEKLGSAPIHLDAMGKDPPAVARTITINLASLDELDLLVGHLLSEF